MKISPVPSSVVPVVDPSGMPTPSRVESIRTIRMKTGTGSGLEEQPGAELEQGPQNSSVDAATQPLSPQLALLAKQKRALQMKEREIADREKALKTGSGTPTIELARLKSEPLRVLLENGVTYEQLHDAIMAGQGEGTSELQALQAKLDALEKGIDQRFTDSATQQEKAVLAEMEKEAKQLVSGEDFEMVREMRAVPSVMQLIERTYRESGEVLEVSEALKLVEDELFKDAQRIAGFKKIQAQFQPQQSQPQQRQYGMRTLTNRDTASVPLSAKQRALAAFNGTLKR